MGFNSWRLLTLSKQNFYVTKMAGELGSILRIQVKQKIVGFYTAEEGSTDFWLQVDISIIAKSRVMGLLVLCPKSITQFLHPLCLLHSLWERKFLPPI